MSDGPGTIKEGVRGTDNCPICGETMKKGRRKSLRQEIIVLVCRGDEPVPHDVSVRLLDE